MKNSLGRRSLLKGLGIAGLGAFSGLLGNDSPVLAATSTNISADDALDRLMEGNRRFTQQQSEYPHQSLKRLQEVAYAQHPYATILSCADSRVPAEIIFDAGIGDLFDIRVAGNIVTPEVLGSLEYAVLQLDTPLIIVLGHERCGAITAAVKGGTLPGSIGTLVAAIQPGIDLGEGVSDESIEKAVVANVAYQINAVKRNSPLITERALKNQLKIVGGRYDLDSGKVEII
ncbi:MAG: carbonic anhydrase [Acaryochloridaceae cyanobacterium RU_4_10]|nr:carbonic anhydrase [Acaryochloridaceae cyanobacterium RU_4_10]